MSTDYKKKYIELRSKYMAAIDTSFRLGYEKGAQEGQMQAQQQQMADQQAQMQQQQAMMGGQVDENGQPVDPSMQDPNAAPQDGQMPQDQEMEQGQPTELDNSIDELQGLLQKGEKPSYVALRDITLKIADLRKAESTRKHVRLEPEQKQEVALQAKIVKDLAKKWKEESKQVANDIKNIL